MENQLEYHAAVHRWFSSGEGWAYHPDMGECLESIRSVLGNEFESRATLRPGQPRIRYLTLENQVLMVVHETDPHCPDEKARPRRPTVLRVLILDQRPPKGEEGGLVEKVCRLTPQSVGPDRTLMLPQGCGPSSERSTSSNRSSGKSFSALLVGLLALTVVAGILKCNGGPTFNRYGSDWSPDSQRTDQAEEEMRRRLREWGYNLGKIKEPKGGGRYGTLHAFLTFLSHGVLEGSHPDALFLRRLPPKEELDLPAVRGHEKLDSRETVQWWHEKLVSLYDHIGGDGADKPPALPEGLGELVERIADLLVYEDWLSDSEIDAAFNVEDEVDHEVRNKVLSFSVAEPYRFEKQWAKRMVKSLTAWGAKGIVEEDAERRPMFVARCYLDFLSRRSTPHFPKKSEPEVDEMTWEREFLLRLPEHPVGLNDERRLPYFDEENRHLDEDDLITALRALKERLNKEGVVAGGGSEVHTLLADIEDCMNYAKWRGKASRNPESLWSYNRLSEKIDDLTENDDAYWDMGKDRKDLVKILDGKHEASKGIRHFVDRFRTTDRPEEGVSPVGLNGETRDE